MAKSARRPGSAKARPYKERVLGALFSLARKKHTSRVSNQALRGQIVRRGSNVAGWKPMSAYLQRAKSALEQLGDIVQDSHYVELTKRAKEGVRSRVSSRAKEDDSSEDERAASTYLRNSNLKTEEGPSESTTDARKRRLSTLRTKEERDGVETEGKMKVTGNKIRRRMLERKQPSSRDDSDLTSLSDLDSENSASVVAYTSPVARGRTRARASTNIVPSLPADPSSLTRLSKSDLIDGYKTSAARIEELEDAMGTVTQGFLALQQANEDLKRRVSMYDTAGSAIGFEESFDGLGQEGEGGDMGGMGEFIFDDVEEDRSRQVVDDSGYHEHLDDASSNAGSDEAAVVSKALLDKTLHRRSSSRSDLSTFDSLPTSKLATIHPFQSTPRRVERTEPWASIRGRQSTPASSHGGDLDPLSSPAVVDHSSSPIRSHPQPGELLSSSSHTKGPTSTATSLFGSERDQYGNGVEAGVSYQSQSKALERLQLSRKNLEWELEAVTKQYQDLVEESKRTSEEVDELRGISLDAAKVSSARGTALFFACRDRDALSNKCAAQSAEIVGLESVVQNLTTHTKDLQLELEETVLSSAAREEDAIRESTLLRDQLATMSTVPLIDASTSTGPDPSIKRLERKLAKATFESTILCDRLSTLTTIPKVHAAVGTGPDPVIDELRYRIATQEADAAEVFEKAEEINRELAGERSAAQEEVRKMIQAVDNGISQILEGEERRKAEADTHRTVVGEKDVTISTLSQTIDDLKQQLQSSAEESSAVFDLLRELAEIYTPDQDPASGTVDRTMHILASVREQVEQASVAKLTINDLTRQLEELTASDADGRVEMELVGAKVRLLEEDVFALQGHLEVSRLELEESRRGAEESATISNQLLIETKARLQDATALNAEKTTELQAQRARYTTLAARLRSLLKMYELVGPSPTTIDWPAEVDVDALSRYLEEQHEARETLAADLEALREDWNTSDAQLMEVREQLEDKLHALQVEKAVVWQRCNELEAELAEEKSHSESMSSAYRATREEYDLKLSQRDQTIADVGVQLTLLEEQSQLVKTRLRNLVAVHEPLPTGDSTPSPSLLDDLDAISHRLGAQGSELNDKSSLLDQARQLAQTIVRQFSHDLGMSESSSLVHDLAAIKERMVVLAHEKEISELGAKEAMIRMEERREYVVQITKKAKELEAFVGPAEATTDRIIGFLEDVRLYLVRSKEERDGEVERLSREMGIKSVELSSVSSACEALRGDVASLKRKLSNRSSLMRTTATLLREGAEDAEEEDTAVEEVSTGAPSPVTVEVEGGGREEVGRVAA